MSILADSILLPVYLYKIYILLLQFYLLNVDGKNRVQNQMEYIRSESKYKTLCRRSGKINLYLFERHFDIHKKKEISKWNRIALSLMHV